MDFELQWLLWALPLAFALGWIASRWDVRQWRRDGDDSPKVYYKGLNFLLNEQHDKAIDAFIEAVQHDPDTSDLHFALGNLFRRRGEYERAVRVHQHLLNRADLAQSDRDRAQHELAQDFMKAGLLDRAEAAYQALEGSAFDTESRLALLALHERSRAWRRAIDVARQLELRGMGSFSTRISHYWCELALEADAAQAAGGHAAVVANAGSTIAANGASAAIGAGAAAATLQDDHGVAIAAAADTTLLADECLRRAREAAPQAARPLVLTGQRAAERGEHEQALQSWGILMSVQPASFNLVARDYAASVLAAGRGPAALERLVASYRQMPTIDLLDAITSLEPDAEARRARLLEHLRQHPTLAAVQALLAEPAADPLATRDTAAVRDAIRRAARPLHRYRCAACGFEAEHYFWQCPGCLGWDTYPPRRLEDL